MTLILKENILLTDGLQFIVASVLVYLRLSDKASKHVVVKMSTAKLQIIYCVPERNSYISVSTHKTTKYAFFLFPLKLVLVRPVCPLPTSRTP